MAWTIKYWDFCQTGIETGLGANASTAIPFCKSFSGTPRVVANYVNCEGGTTCISNISVGSFTLHTGLAGTVNWIAIYNVEC